MKIVEPGRVKLLMLDQKIKKTKRIRKKKFKLGDINGSDVNAKKS